MPDQESFIGNKHPGFYMDKYGSSKLLAVEVWKDLQYVHEVVGPSSAENGIVYKDMHHLSVGSVSCSS